MPRIPLTLYLSLWILALSLWGAAHWEWGSHNLTCSGFMLLQRETELLTCSVEASARNRVGKSFWWHLSQEATRLVGGSTNNWKEIPPWTGGRKKRLSRNNHRAIKLQCIFICCHCSCGGHWICSDGLHMPFKCLCFKISCFSIYALFNIYT